MVKESPEHLPPRRKVHLGGRTAQRCGSPMRHSCQSTVWLPACCTPWGVHATCYRRPLCRWWTAVPQQGSIAARWSPLCLRCWQDSADQEGRQYGTKGVLGACLGPQLQSKMSASSQVGFTQHCSARPLAPVTHAVPLTHPAVADTHRAHPLPHLATAGRHGWQQQPKLHPTPGTAQTG